MPAFSIAGPLDTWTWRNPLPQGNNLNAITYGSGLFVAVGDNGTILTSADNGVTWTKRTSGTTCNLYSVTFNGSNLFVAVGESGKAVTSADGVTWTVVVNPGLCGNVYGIAYGVVAGNGMFVAVGDSSGCGTTAFFKSDDGQTWTLVSATTGGTLYGVAYGNTDGGKFYAVGEAGSKNEYNGTTWTHTSGASEYRGVAFGNNGVVNAFVTVAGSDRAIAFSGGVYVAVGQSGVTKRSINNGVNWGTVSGDAWAQANELNGVAYGAGFFVAVGDAGTILSSANDGTTWTKRSSEITKGLNAIAYGTPADSGLFIAVGADGTILKSPDGATWTSVDSGSIRTLNAVVYGNGLFVVVGSNGTILTSPNGNAPWTLRNDGVTFSPLYGVAFGNGVFVAVGGDLFGVAKIFTSEDGIVWTSRTSGVINYLTAVAYGNNKFVAVGATYDGTAIILLSTNNGVDWSRSPSGTTEWFYGAIYGNNQFAAVGSRYMVRTSADGSSWSGGLGVNVVYRAVSHGNGAFAVVGDTGTLRTSSNGSSWTTRTSGTTNSLYGVTFGNNTFVAVGNYGTIFQSGTIVPPQVSVAPSPVASGSVDVGSSSSPTQITVSNPGGSDLLISSISISGNDAAMFSVSEGGDNACASLAPTIAADGNCTLLITFTPESSGAKSATLSIVSNDPASPKAVALSGTGVQYTLTVAGAAGTSTGSIAGSNSISCSVAANGATSGTCSEVRNSGAVTLTATPPVGTTVNWNSCTVGNGNTCSVTLNQNKTITASFTLNTYTVTPSAGLNGTISNDPQSVNYGSTTTFTVTPDNGYTASVGGTCGGSLNDTTYTTNAITADCTVIASFTLPPHTVAPSAGQNGAINPATPQSVNHGTTTTFTVTPANGHTASVGGTCGGSLSNTTYTTNPITADCTVSASFTLITYTVTPSAGAGGSIALNTPQTVSHGSTTTFTVTAANGYIASVSGTCGGALNNTTYTTNAVTANCTVAATFAPCTYTLSSNSQTFSASNGTGSVNVTAAAGDCPWTATSNAQWITVTSGGSGTGNGAAGYSITQNTGKSARNGTLTIAGHTYTVSQAGVGCTYSLSPADKTFNNAAGSGSISVIASANDCSWSVSVSDPWITISSGDSGSGNGTVEYAVAANTNSAPRQGTVTIANRTFSITQTGVDCAYSLSSASEEFTVSGGTGSIDATASAGDCAWTATSNNPWISIVSGGSSTGNATVTYSVAENSSSDPRSGTLAIAGQAYSISQEGNPDVVAEQYTITINSTGTGSGSVTSDTGTLTCDSGTCTGVYDSGAQITLTAGAEEGSKFAGWAGEGCEGNDTCILTITADITVIAQFTLSNQVALSVSKAGSGSGSIKFSSKGTICGTDCYIYGLSLKRPKKIVVTARPSAGSKFISWSGDYEGTKASLTAVMNEDRALTATFGKPGLSVPEDTIDFGSVAKKQTASRTLTIENNGDAPLRVGLKIVGQGTGMFRLFNGENDRPISSYTVPLGGSLQVIIKFRPTATGLRSVKLQILSDDAEKPKVEVPLTATGTAAPSK